MKLVADIAALYAAVADTRVWPLCTFCVAVKICGRCFVAVLD